MFIQEFSGMLKNSQQYSTMVRHMGILSRVSHNSCSGGGGAPGVGWAEQPATSTGSSLYQLMSTYKP